MRRNIFQLLMVILFCTSGFTTSFAQTIKITNGEWAPYLSESLPKYGSASQIVAEAFAKEGIDVTYGFFTWARAYEEAKKGTEWHASVIWTKNSDREDSFYYSDPVLQLEDVLFYMRGKNLEWDNFEDLSKYRIGLTRGYYYGDEIASAEKSKKINIERTTTEVLNFKKLLRGRVDSVVANEDVGYAIIKENFADAARYAFTHHPKPTRIVNYHVIISKKAPGAKEYISALNRGLRKLAEKGRIQAILR